MAKKKCPGCGAWYDGRRCPECLYEPFSAEEVPVLHDRVPRQPADTRRYVGKPVSRSGRQHHKGPGIRVLGITIILIFMSVFLVTLFAATSSVVSDFAVAAPEPLPLPEDGMLLYDQDGIRVILDWSGEAITGDIPVYVENHSQRDIAASTAGVAVNGCMNDDVFFYCDAREGTSAKSQLWIDTAELQKLGIDEIQEVSFLLEIFDENSYEVLNDREIYTIGPGGASSRPDSSGQILWEDSNIKLVFQGVEQDEYGFLYFRFYAEDLSGGTLELSTSELLVNGEESGQYLYQHFFPDTAAVLLIELYQADALGITDVQDVNTLTFTASTVVDENWGAQISQDITASIG